MILLIVILAVLMVLLLFRRKPGPTNDVPSLIVPVPEPDIDFIPMVDETSVADTFVPGGGDFGGAGASESWGDSGGGDGSGD